jgi:hypothetical protein
MTQTEMHTVCCDGKKFEIVLRVKEEGKAAKLKNIIVFDEVTEEERSRGQEVGLKVYSF